MTDMPADPPAFFQFAPNPASMDFGVTRAKALTVPCGEHGNVVVEFDTGNVRFTGDCNPDEGSKAFYDALSKMGLTPKPKGDN